MPEPKPTPGPAAAPGVGPAPAPAFQSLPPRTATGTNASAQLPSGYQPSVPAPDAGDTPSSLPPAGYSPTAGTYVDSQGVTRRIGEDGSTAPVASAPANNAPTGPQPSMPSPSSVGQEPTPLLPPVETMTTVTPTPAPTPTTTPMGPPAPSAERPSLTAVVGSVAVPEAEKASAIVPVTPDLIANTPGVVPPPRVVSPKTETPKPEPVKAEPKPSAKTTTAKVAPKAGKKPAEKPAVTHPKRFWVQIATGYEINGLSFEFNRASRANPALFKGLKGWSSKQGKSLRLVVGPFATSAEAKAWEKKYLATGAQGFAWQSPDGTVVEPLPSR